jgi:[acyl-carrier-protein] S-malonyltransferase
MLASVPQLEALDRLVDAAEALSGLELRTLVALGTQDDLADTRVAQPLLYLVDWAWGTTLLECGLRPSAFAGHSLGEFAALALAEVFSVEAGLELVVERSQLMAAAAASLSGGMAAVIGLDPETVRDVVDAIEDVWVANDNAPGQLVVSGTDTALETATAALTDAGARRVIRLAVSGPFHSPLMASAGDAFAEVLRGAQMRDASTPVLQNTLPVPTTDAETIRDRLIAQIVSPVRWTETMTALAADGPAIVVEAGPASVLTGLARRMEGITAMSVEDTEIESILQEVS